MIMLSVKGKKISFQHRRLYLFIFFSCLAALAKTPRTMLNRSGQCGCPCLILDIKERSIQCLLLIRMLVGFPIVVPFIRLRKLPPF